MAWGFEQGRIYNRRADVHSRFGGQQQGGIITPREYSMVIIITGEEGKSHGYGDRLREDGVFEYFGEGQVGDMRMIAGNKAIAEHSASGKQLLLFRKTKVGLRFEGEMVCESYFEQAAKDREGTDRKAIVFELRSINAVVEKTEDMPVSSTSASSLDELRKRALEAATAGLKKSSAGIRTVYQRSLDVKNYVLARSGPTCEGCTSPAPFLRPDGSPYLEPHHIRRVSDGGPDHPAHVIALCPNCHRRVHAGADGAAFNACLAKKMMAIEPK